MDSLLYLQSCPVDSKIQKDFTLQESGIGPGFGREMQMGWPCLLQFSPVFFVLTIFLSKTQRPTEHKSETPFFKYLEGFTWHFQVTKKSEPFPC